MNEIEKIASKHLGKAGDGTVVAPYVTPELIDSDLLVAIPRVLNRKQYGIDEADLPFVGFDMWNCYEVSAMTDNGYPVSGIVKLSYSSNSDCIVESKSLKLYLNSFNLSRLGETPLKVKHAVEKNIRRDLSLLLNTDVQVYMHIPNGARNPSPSLLTQATTIENIVDVSRLEFESFTESPELLNVTTFVSESESLWHTNALRSNCRVTNQPDWGDVYIYIKGRRSITPQSLLQYIVSMRKENHFHEEIVECIFKRLTDALPESEVAVCALYTRRGGIDINPVRATSAKLLSRFDFIGNATVKHIKTDRQ